MLVKVIHIFCAVLSASLFFARGVLILKHGRIRQKLLRIIPHLIDTLLLATALMMVFQWQLNPLHHPWLLAKIIALLLYIWMGLMAFRYSRGKAQRLAWWLGALLVVAYIFTTAFTKNPMAFFLMA
jgi:uncharacterized membrane protein SirB2